MAITITSIRRQDGHDASISGTGEETVRESFIVTVDLANATPLEVNRATATGLPAFGESYGVDTTLKVTDKKSSRAVGSDGKRSRHDWIVEVTYSLPDSTSAPSGSGPSGNTPNSREIRVSVGGAEQTFSTQLNANSGKIVNANGDMIEPVEITKYDEQITIDYESNTFDPSTAAAIRGRLNDATVSMSLPQGNKTWTRSFAAKTLLLKSVDYDVGISRDSSHTYKVRVTCLFREENWDMSIPQKGYRWKDDAGMLTAWQDTAAYLTADGKKLVAGSEVVAFNCPVFRTSSGVKSFLENI